MAMADGASFSLDMPPGQARTLVYTFRIPGVLLYGCRVPGPYAAGMRGTITVKNT